MLAPKPRLAARGRGRGSQDWVHAQRARAEVICIWKPSNQVFLEGGWGQGKQTYLLGACLRRMDMIHRSHGCVPSCVGPPGFFSVPLAGGVAHSLLLLHNPVCAEYDDPPFHPYCAWTWLEMRDDFSKFTSQPKLWMKSKSVMWGPEVSPYPGDKRATGPSTHAHVRRAASWDVQLLPPLGPSVSDGSWPDPPNKSPIYQARVVDGLGAHVN